MTRTMIYGPGYIDVPFDYVESQYAPDTAVVIEGAVIPDATGGDAWSAVGEGSYSTMRLAPVGSPPGTFDPQPIHAAVSPAPDLPQEPPTEMRIVAIMRCSPGTSLRYLNFETGYPYWGLTMDKYTPMPSDGSWVEVLSDPVPTLLNDPANPNDQWGGTDTSEFGHGPPTVDELRTGIQTGLNIGNSGLEIMRIWPWCDNDETVPGTVPIADETIEIDYMAFRLYYPEVISNAIQFERRRFA